MLVDIRPAQLDDAERIATLMDQLGYDVPPADIAGRLQRRRERRQVLVATSGDDVLGWAAVCTDEPFVEGFGAHLEGLVVDEGSRSDGIGAALLNAAEEWAREHGCTEMRIQSNVVRQRAHDFYQQHGYATIKAQYRLRKRL